MRKIAILLILIIFTVFSPIGIAKEKKPKQRAVVQTEFILKEATNDVIFVTSEELKINDNLIIPKGAVIYADNFQAQRALRWHKSGFIICHIKKYAVNEFSDETIDLSDKDLYLVVKKYEKIYKKDAAILATEIIVTQGASFFAPGADILYFFSKGAILREKHQNWFKAGVFNAYENSICWFWLKGKKINLSQGDDINLKVINKESAYKLKTKMVKRKTREDMIALKKQLKKDFKLVKKIEKEEIKNLKKELKSEEKLAKKGVKNVHAAVKVEEVVLEKDEL